MSRISITEEHYKRLCDDARRYRYIKEKSKEVLIEEFPDSGSVDSPHPGCKYVLPEFVSYKDFCGQIEFDEAVDIAISKEISRDT